MIVIANHKSTNKINSLKRLIVLKISLVLVMMEYPQVFKEYRIISNMEWRRDPKFLKQKAEKLNEMKKNGAQISKIEYISAEYGKPN
ncbi:MAG: hypothetical protein LBR15_09600 [Methanobrevibacter sp.]|nr:hypothetical protein [Candidatus Methanovirga australis]